MKCAIPEISWHNRDPVLSVDIQPKLQDSKTDNILRLASGGTDSHVLIWYMIWNDNGSINLDLAADLARHQRAVNVVRWSPNGEFLASGDDESVIFIWKLKEKNETINILDETNEQDKEIWINAKILRGHLEDIYDLSWSPNSDFLVSGSVDNTAIIWDVQKGRSTAMLRDHKSFVQGVAWDPKDEIVATLSSDRYMRVFDLKTKKCLSRVNKCILPVPSSNELFDKQVRIYHDDTLQTFFRRLCFSPDGNLIITPAGLTDCDSINKRLDCTYIYSRHSLKQPSIILPSPDEYTVAVKCCPVLFQLHDCGPDPIVDLPYRMVFSVATKSSVYLYDTQQTVPFGVVSNIHYTRISDLAWSNDARILIVSSTDGFCSIITFEDKELGEIYKTQDENIQSSSKDKINKTEQNVDENIQCIKTPKKCDSMQNKRETSDKNTPTLKNLQNFVLDKELLSVDEKFLSPSGKKARQPTPIAVRRTPRIMLENKNNENVISKEIQSKAIISSRRQLTDSSAFTEEAREAWPTPLELMDVDHTEANQTQKINSLEPSTIIEISEDIQLVMEETQTQDDKNIM